MIRRDIVFAVAHAEARLIRRLVRYWVFSGLAAILGLLGYLYYGALHGFFSSYSASVSAISPKYLIGAIGIFYLLVFLVGLVLLTFDVRARDERERIAEVLDSRPSTNLEILAGRSLGIVAMSWLPLAGTMALIQFLGWLGLTLGWPFCEPIETQSVLAFLTWVAIPGLAFMVALVFLVSLLVRNRLLTAVLVLGFLGALAWTGFKTSLDMVAVFDVIGIYTLNFPSELVRDAMGPSGPLQRAAVLIAACGLLLLATAVHPRRDGGPGRIFAFGGAGLLLAAVAIFGGLARQALADRAVFEGWKAAHEARRDAPVPDVEAITGVVEIDPGRALGVELEIRFKAPEDAALETALFTLNPGLTVDAIRGAAGEPLDFTHAQGLLEVTLERPLAAGAENRLAMTFGGRPDLAFAYLDAPQRPAALDPSSANLGLLGITPDVFDKRFVTLMPGGRCLPAAGADVGRDEADRRADFFRIDLTVDLPDGWRAAGPGRRREVEGAGEGRARFRFAPPAPVPEAALVASRFESRSVELEGVELEILVSPRHRRNLELFADTTEEIQQWIGDRLREAADLGLAYPYDALTLVEVPSTLRGYGGGWRMDTVMAPPAMILMRESSFPIARFDTRFRKPEDFADREGGLPRAKREVLESFFEGDFNGGNLFLGAARNFFAHQTAARGSGARALDFVCHDLVNRLTTGKQGYFSTYVFGSGFNQTISEAVTTYLTRRRSGGTITDALLRVATQRPEVWDQALGVALAEMDPWEDPRRTLDVLALRGGAVARSVVDGLGRERAGELLATLRRRSAGGTFDRDDLTAVTAELGLDLAAVTGDWLDETELPGFIASGAELVRLADAEDGSPRYQVALHLYNAEAAPGLLRLSYRLGGDDDGGQGQRRWEQSEAVTVGGGEAVEVGLVLSKPPARLFVSPYLSLNRQSFAVALPSVDEERVVEAEPFSGSRASDWRPAASAAIVVDDLDPGFSVEEGEGGGGFRLGGRGLAEGLDQGLPVAKAFQPPAVWSRRQLGSAWGTYRHTAASIRKGRGDKRAVFTAELPRSGRWRLELHLPPVSGGSQFDLLWRAGTYHLALVDASGRQEITFDAAGAEDYWNDLGEHEVAGGEVRVELSDKTDGAAVTADAIRWRPTTSAASGADEGATEGAAP